MDPERDAIADDTPGQLVADGSPSPPLDRAELAGRCVELRPLDARRDAASLYAISHGSAERERVWQYLGYGPFASVAAMQVLLGVRERSEDPLFYTVVDVASGEPAGQVSLLSFDRWARRIELGHIWYGARYHRSRVNTEACYLLLREAFD